MKKTIILGLAAMLVAITANAQDRADQQHLLSFASFCTNKS